MIDIPPDIKKEITKLLSPSVTYKGKPVEFLIADGQHLYNYFLDSRGVMHCYTPHPSTDGGYFAWDYSPVGKGSKSGKSTHWKMKKIVRCALRNSAKHKAIERTLRGNSHKVT